MMIRARKKNEVRKRNLVEGRSFKKVLPRRWHLNKDLDEIRLQTIWVCRGGVCQGEKRVNPVALKQEQTWPTHETRQRIIWLKQSEQGETSRIHETNNFFIWGHSGYLLHFDFINNFTLNIS